MYKKILFKKIIVILLIFGQIAPSFSMEPEKEEVEGPRGGQAAPALMESEEKMEVPRDGMQRHSEPKIIKTINAKIGHIYGEYHVRSPLLQQKPPLVTALVIISPKDPEAPEVGDDEVNAGSKRYVPKRADHGYQDDKLKLMGAFDERFFRQNMPIKTRVVQGTFALVGLAQLIALPPVVLYVSQTLPFIKDLPVDGAASLSIVYTVFAFSSVASGRQMWERAKAIMNTCFDHNGLIPSKNDADPHPTKLKVEYGTKGWNKCLKFFSTIPIENFGKVFAVLNGSLRALPYAMLFWEAEEEFSTFRYVFIGPLALFLFDKAYSESLKFWNLTAHKLFTAKDQMTVIKKEILRDRVKDMESYLTTPNSDALVKVLYKTITTEIKSRKQEEGVQKKDSLFAVSALLLRRDIAEIYDNLPTMARRVASQHLQDKELLDVAETLDTAEVQRAHNLLGDIDQVYAPTNARTLFERLALVLTGAAFTGRFIVTEWAVEHFLEAIIGLPAEASFITATSFAAADLVLRAAAEYYTQKATALELRSIGSRRRDFWPLRGVSKVVAIYTSLFYALTPLAIILNVFSGKHELTDYTEFSDSSDFSDSSYVSRLPFYIPVLIAIFAAIPEFSSFFKFFSEKYEEIIRGVATWRDLDIPPNNVRQQRSWLLDKCDELQEWIHELDEPTTQQLYHITQRGF